MKKTIVTIGLLLIVATAYAVGLSDKDEAKFASAVKAYRMNQNAEALRIFTELYKDYPQNQQIKNNYAVLLFVDGKIEKAEEVLSSVIESNKEVNIAFKNLNKIYDYAAAKAYSNALGTEKEVVPQKLQIIDTLSHTNAEIAVAAVEPPKLEQKPVAPVTPPPAPIEPKTAVKVVETEPATTASAPVKPTAKEATKAEPQPTAATPPPPVTVDIEAIKASIAKVTNDWAATWSKGDANAYIAFYKATYSPDKNTTHKQWLENRKQRISPAKNIQVKISDVVITADKSSPDTMLATFKQSYQSNQHKDYTSKQLVWKKSGNQWLIDKEVLL